MKAPYGFVLSKIVKLPDPIPCKGAQGLWSVPLEIEQRIVETLSIMNTPIES